MFERLRERYRRWRQRKLAKRHQLQVLQEELKNLASEIEESKVMQQNTNKERDALANKVAELEGILASEREHHQQEKNKANLACEESNVIHVQKITELQASLTVCERKQKSAEHKSERLTREQEKLEKYIAQLEVTLAFEREHYMQERNKIKLANEERSATYIQKITALQVTQTLCEGQQLIAETERENWMRERERLERRIAQLEATLAFTQEKSNLDTEQSNTGFLRNLFRFKPSLNL